MRRSNPITATSKSKRNMPQLVRSSTEYNYSQEDLIYLISKDLRIPAEKLTVNFVHEDTLDRRKDDPFKFKSVIVAKVTIDHSKEVSVLKSVPHSKSVPVRRSWSDEYTLWNFIRACVLKNDGEMPEQMNELFTVEEAKLDELSQIDVIMSIESSYNIAISDNEMDSIRNFRDIANLIKSKLAQ